MTEKIVPAPIPGLAEDEKVPLPTPPEETLERWNGTRVNTFRFFVALWSFIIMGMNDAAIGVSSPIVSRYPML